MVSPLVLTHCSPAVLCSCRAGGQGIPDCTRIGLGGVLQLLEPDVCFIITFWALTSLTFMCFLRAPLRMDFLAGFIVVAAVSRTQRLALHSTFVFSFPLWKLPKLFFFSPLAFELFFHPRFVSLHCRHVSDIKTYVTITRQ